MTPTYFGRIQTRIFLLGTVGLFITWLFAMLSDNHDNRVYAALAYILLFGIAWDFLYHLWQQRRWDHDWPPSHQLLAGVIEGLFLWVVVNFIVALPGIENPPPTAAYWWHYSVVWLFVFAASQSVMRILFPRWRYFGGEWI